MLVFGSATFPVHEVIRFPDPFEACRDFLKEATGHPTGFARPDDYTARSGPFIRIEDTGGAGVYGIAFEDVRLTVEVYAGSRGQASDIARTVYALLRQWERLDARVKWRGTVSRPQFYPDDTRIPRYVLTVNLAFRGALVNVSPVQP